MAKQLSIFDLKKVLNEATNFPELNQQVWKCVFEKKCGKNIFYTTRYFILKPRIRTLKCEIDDIYLLLKNNKWNDINIEDIKK